MGIPINYRKTREAAIATYDFVDIASGTGYRIFYGGQAPSGSTFLSGQQIASDRVSMDSGAAAAVAANEASATPKVNRNFDMLFNLPQNIKGKAIIEIPHGWYDSGNQTTYQKIFCQIQKWDGTTATTLVACSGGQWLALGQGAAAENKDTNSTVTGEIPLTHFKKGESLRLNIYDNTWEAGGNAHRVYIGADPLGRLQTDKDNDAQVKFISGSTVLKAYIPFRIDL